MGFKARPSTYAIELAPTARARCRKCRRRMSIGSVRVATTAFVQPGRAARFVRCAAPACLDAPFAAAVLAVYRDADRIPATAGVEAASDVRRMITEAATRSVPPPSSACVRA